MNVWEKTRGCPSMFFEEVFVGTGLGFPWTTVPETVTSNEGGDVPTKSQVN